VAVAPAAVVVAAEKIELNETILFGYDNAANKPESRPLIDEIAKVLTQHPEIELISVEGHTDNRGSATHNRKLSEARAKAVLEGSRPVVLQADRLTSKGFGLSRPLDDADTDEARAKNPHRAAHRAQGSASVTASVAIVALALLASEACQNTSLVMRWSVRVSSV
jgi:outer membrane protein OmpA-like peptidoglycan-associated protein